MNTFPPLGITLHGCVCTGFCLKGHSPDYDEDDHYQTDGNRQLQKKQNGELSTNDKHIELETVSTDTSENGINLNKIDAEKNKKKLANIKNKSNDHHSHRHGHHSHDHDSDSINVRAAIIHVLGKRCFYDFFFFLNYFTSFFFYFNFKFDFFSNTSFTHVLLIFTFSSSFIYFKPLFFLILTIQKTNIT